MVKQAYRIRGMHCPNCAMRIEGIEDEMEGIKRVLVSYQKENMVIEYNEEQISEGDIIIKLNQLGYHAEPTSY